MREATEILKALMMLRSSFQKLGLEVPTAIVLKDADEGLRLLYCLKDPSFEVRQYVEEDMVMSTVKVMGIEVRWPSKKYMQPDGEVRYL